MKTINFLSLLFFFLMSIGINAQIDSMKMDLYLKTRAEINNGESTLIPKGKNAMGEVESRARMGLNFFFKQLEIRIVGQDARNWGNTGTSPAVNSLVFYEAWAKYNFNPHLYLKLGRQTLSYDNGRMVWEGDWSMKGKSFDALKLGYSFNNDSRFEAVGIYNSISSKRNDEIVNEEYDVIQGGERTKSMQLLHFQNSRKKNFKYSLLLMNNVVQKDDGRFNSLSTAGLYLIHQFNPSFDFNAAAYYQFGKNTADQEKNAYDFAINFGYKPTSFLKMILGGELVSGTKYDESADKNTSFSPIYGTGYTLNSHLNYFYVGSHFNGPGLIDLSLKNNFSFDRFGTLYIAAHYFSAHTEFQPDTKKYLGTELDIMYGKKIGNNFLFNVGYYQMFAGQGLKIIKNVPNPKSFQGLIWIGFSFRPDFRLL